MRVEEVQPAEQRLALEIAERPFEGYDTPIEALGLSVRAYNCLKRSGLMTVGAQGDAATRLSLSSDKTEYRVGETARVQVPGGGPGRRPPARCRAA